jgi:LCP family protein required for cell wall assembly
MERRTKKKTRIKNKKRFYTIIIVVSVLVLSGVAYGAHYYNQLKNPQDLFSPIDNEDEIDINAQFDKNIINIMLVGFDKDEKRSKTSELFRTDTNIVVTINLEEQTVDMISIPRDSFVPIAHRGGGKDKFNSAFGYGYRYGDGEDKEEDGFKYLMDTASELLGDIPLHYYVAVDMDVVVEVVDAIGGVEMEVPIDLYRRHGRDRSKIIVDKGFQRLDGHDLLYYARYRHFPRGDIDRVENQQKILMATFDSLKKSNMFSSLPKIYQSVQKNLITNLNLNQIAALALFGKNMDKENINTHTMPGDFGNLNELSYWIIDQDERVKLIEDIYGITIVADEQDPTEDKLVTLDVKISKDILDIGEKAEISTEGTTNLGYHKMFDPGDLNYESSNSDIATVNDNGIVTAISPGNATITLRVGGISKQINVTVKAPPDKTPPVISLIGEKTITLNVGDAFKDPGAKATDDVDGDISDRIVTSISPGKINTSQPGEYTITYSVSDKSGNAAKTVARTVIVKNKEQVEPPVDPPVQDPEDPEDPGEDDSEEPVDPEPGTGDPETPPKNEEA